MPLRPLAVAAALVLAAAACGDSDGDDTADPDAPSTTVPSPPAGPPELLLSSGFDEGVSVDDELADIHGVDTETGFDWDDDPAWVDRSEFYHAVRSDDLTEFIDSEIVETTGPDGEPTRALHLINKGDDPDEPSTTRNEFSFFSEDAPDDLKEGFVRYWTKLQPDLDTIVGTGDESRVYYLMETKDRDLGSQGTDEGFSSFRTNVGLARDDDGRLYWVATGEQVQPEREIVWQSRNDTVEVPLGEWFLVEAYLRRGSPDGRLYFAVDGQTVFDVSAPMSHLDDPQPHLFWSIFKLYHDPAWWASGPTEQWYDDVELWSSFPPDHPALAPVQP